MKTTDNTKTFQLPEQLRIHTLHPSNTLLDLQDTVRRRGPDIVKTGVPMYIMVDGYNDDARELGDIPEVRHLCERVIDSGLLSLLHPNLIERNPMLWGAIDVWAAAKGLIRNRKLALSRPAVQEFETALLQSNDVADAVMAAGTLAPVATLEPGEHIGESCEGSASESACEIPRTAFLLDLHARHQRGDEFAEGRTTKDELAAEGLRWWPICFRGQRSDDDAFGAATAAYLPVVGNQDRPLDVRVLLRQIATARWCDQGFPVVQMAHTYAAALMATKVAPDLATDVRPPWRAFVIQLPHPLVSIAFGSGEVANANMVLVRIAEHQERGTEWSFWVFHDRGYLAYEGLAPNELLADDLNEDMQGCPNAIRGDAKIDVEVLNRIRLLVARLVLNACCVMTNEPVHLKPLRSAKPKRRIGRDRPEPPQYRYFALGEPIQVDCRQAIRGFLTPGSRRQATAPSVMTLVCGHRKQQAYGPRRSLRKPIWVQPYWRGPDGAPIVIRPHMRGDQLAKTAPSEAGASGGADPKLVVAS